MRAPLLLLLAALLLGGCSAQPGARTASLEERYASLQNREAAPVEAAALSTRPAAATSLVPGLSDGSLSARVAKSEPQGAGRRSLVSLENGKQTRGWIASSAAPDVERLRQMVAPPTEASIRAEMGQIFPSGAMNVLTEPRRNAFGPYGLAVGVDRAGGRCVFAWQWIDSDPALAGSVSLRARLCSSVLRLDDLAALLDGLRLTEQGGMTREAARPARRRRAASSAPREAPVRVGTAAEPRTSPVRPAARPDVAVPLDPAFRTAPELALPSQALRGPAPALRAVQPTPDRSS